MTTSDAIVGETPHSRPVVAAEEHDAAPVTAGLGLDLETLAIAEPVVEAPAPAVFAVPAAQDALRTSRFTFKGGLYSADADEISDDGWIVNASWMRFFTNIFALELEIGYLDASGEDNATNTDVDVWGMPIMVNGRANLPVWVLDLYGGLGVGTVYYDAEVTGGATADDDGFLLGGNAFLGATVNVADRIAMGLEAKYYVTEDVDDVDESLDAFAIMLTLGWSN